MNTYHQDIESVKNSLMVGSSPRRYICEVQRQLYDFIDENIESVEIKKQGLDLIAEAFWMGKRISDRLTELKAGWDEDDWEENETFYDDLYRRAARLHLLKSIKSVNIQTINYCNRKCSWCPNSKMDKSIDDKMTLNVFNRVLRQLLDYGFAGEIHPFLMGEPLTDNRIGALCKIIKEYFPKLRTKIITNGVNLESAEDVRDLLSCGVDSIHVNHYDWEDKGKLRDADFPEISHFGMAALRPTFYNRAGKVDCSPTKKHKRCEWFLHKLCFNWKGDVVLCCSDYDFEVVFGNIMEQPLASILNSKLYRKYYYAHKEGKAKELLMCKECNRI